MRSIIRFHAYVIAISLIIAISPTGASGDDARSFGLGLGGGISELGGDYLMTKHLAGFTLGMDMERDDLMVTWRSVADKDNRASSFDVRVGGGWRYFKIGVGLFYESVDAPPAVPSGFLALPDPARNTSITVHSWPLTMRVHPWLSDHFRTAIDGYYGVRATGSMKVPLYFFPGGDIQTQPQRAGGMSGYDAILQWWPSSRHEISFMLAVSEDQGRMNHTQTSFTNDPFELYGRVVIPEIRYRVRQRMLSVMMPL